jgi:hypothetical protein
MSVQKGDGLASQPESVIKRHVYEYLCMCPEFFGFISTNTGIYDPTRKCFRKRTSGQMLGVSDIIGSWHGIFLAVEIKTPTGRLTEPQKEFQRRVIEKGGVAFVIHSVEEIVDLVQSLRIAGDENTSNN